jgi:hypothetical protein
MAFLHNMFSMSDSQQAHNDIFGEQSSHHSTWTHEVVSGAAGFAGKIPIIFEIFYCIR